MKRLTLSSCAKLNMSLSIADKRAAPPREGYHNIVSEMQEIDLADTVCVRVTNSPHVTPKIRITCDNPQVPVNRRNVAYRAAEAFVRASGLHLVIKVDIIKQIPLMAGLGGSSTNGAAVIKALNTLSGDLFTAEELISLAAGIGSDVPFALVGGRARCEGIGEIITPLPDLPEQFYAIVQPNFCCDTRAAYALWDTNPSIARKHANVFQDLYGDPRIDGICSELLRLGAQSASMTGSGSAVFGVFGEEAAAQSALAAFDAPQYPFKCIARNIRR
jgi:4-diphosphocytidyl-2-C-methyl-D-erythritol kinase